MAVKFKIIFIFLEILAYLSSMAQGNRFDIIVKTHPATMIIRKEYNFGIEIGEKERFRITANYFNQNRFPYYYTNSFLTDYQKTKQIQGNAIRLGAKFFVGLEDKLSGRYYVEPQIRYGKIEDEYTCFRSGIGMVTMKREVKTPQVSLLIGRQLVIEKIVVDTYIGTSYFKNFKKNLSPEFCGNFTDGYLFENDSGFLFLVGFSFGINFTAD